MCNERVDPIKFINFLNFLIMRPLMFSCYFLLVLTNTHVFSQAREYLSENNRLVGFSGFFSWNNYNIDNLDFKEYKYNFRANAGALVNNRFGLGVDINYDYTTLKEDNAASDIGSLMVGAFGRYYIFFGNENITVFPEIILSYVRTYLDVIEETYGFGYKAGGGIAWFITSNIAPEIELLYSNQYLTADNDIELNKFQINLGLQLYLNY